MSLIDGCATFFRRDRFSHVKKYEVCKFSCGISFGFSINFWMMYISFLQLLIWLLYFLQVEFNKAAQSLTDALLPSAQKKNALGRLVKVGCIFLFSFYVRVLLVGGVGFVVR